MSNDIKKEIDKLEGDNIEIVDKSSSLQQLEDEWGRFNDMPKKWRRVSDWKSMELFGMTNQDHYEKMKSGLLAKDDYHIEDIPLDEAYEMQEKQPLSKIDYGENAIEAAKEWAVNAVRTIIIPQNTEQELEELWQEWNQMILKHRRESDWKSLELFGVKNKEHYEILKSKFLRKDFDDDPDEVIEPEKDALTKLDIFEANSYIENLCRYTNNISNDTERLLCCLELSSIEEKTNYEEILINNTVDRALQRHYSLNRIGLGIMFDDLPFFEPTEMEDMGVYCSEPYYGVQPDNSYINDENSISSRTWFENYKKLTQGALTIEMKNMTLLWVRKLNELYSTFDEIKKSGDNDKINARKQSILELGWNPEIDFSRDTRTSVTMRTIRNIGAKYGNTEIIDMSNVVEAATSYQADKYDEDANTLYPIFIVLVYTGSKFGKLIVKYTNAKYSHAAIGFDSDLQRLYSFNQNQSGFSLESLSGYSKNKDSIMAVYSVFVKKKDMIKIKTKLDYFILNKNKTHYSIANIFGIVTNKVINLDMSMICSQFVDSLLKVADIDITGKNSGLVMPSDFTKVKNKKVYRMFEGKCIDYNKTKIDNTINALKSKYKYIKESTIDAALYIDHICKNIYNINEWSNINSIYQTLNENSRKIFDLLKPSISAQPMTEAKEFPVQFDKDGNLLIKRMKSLDFESEYAQTHKLLVLYEDKNNTDGIKYELSKLWFMNTILEKKIYTKGKSTDEQLDSYHKARAKILNDFNKYLKLVLKEDSEFNFREYYNDSPFSDAATKINSSTLKYSGELIKSLLKL